MNFEAEPPSFAQDVLFMRSALLEAEKGLWTTTPNPRVGCVFVRNGHIIAQGFHEKPGYAHAEVKAIEHAKQHNISLRGSTVYVTLEPCSHVGRTGPCTQALISAGVKRVVAAGIDPNPKVNGQGIELLQQAGISTTVGILEKEARWLNRGYFSSIDRGRPWVRLKIASSADGVTALNNGVSQWITSPEARKHGQSLRAQACAIVSGLGTVNADNPELNVRAYETSRQPVKIIIDSTLRINPSMKLLQQGQSILVHNTNKTPDWLNSHPNQHNIKLIKAEPSENPNTDHINLDHLLSTLLQHDIHEIHLEAGYSLNGSFFKADLVDEIAQYIAPKFLGNGLGLMQLPELSEIPENNWEVRQVNTIGQDVFINWVKAGSQKPNHT